VKKTLSLLFSFTFLFAVSCAKENKHRSSSADQELANCLGMIKKKSYEDGLLCLENVKARYPSSRAAQDAELKIADSYFQQEDYLLAAESYIGYIKLYPRNKNVDYAYYRAGLSYYHSSPKAIDRDQEYLADAVGYFETLITHYPQSPYLNIAQKLRFDSRVKIAERHFYVAKFYFKTKEYVASIPRFEEIVEKFSETPHVPESLFHIVKANLKLKNLEAAKNAYGKLALEHEKSKWTKKAESILIRASKKMK